MKREHLTLDYDAETDVLYLSFGKPHPAVTEEIWNIGLRIDDKTKEIVGVTVTEFLKIVRAKHRPIKITV